MEQPKSPYLLRGHSITTWTRWGGGQKMSVFVHTVLHVLKLITPCICMKLIQWKTLNQLFLLFNFRWIVTKFILKQWSLQSRALLQFRRFKCRTSASICWRGSGISRKSWKYFRKNMDRCEQFFLVKTWRRYGNDERFYWSACCCCQTSFCTLVIIFAFDKWGKKKLWTCKGHDAVVSLSAGDDMRPDKAFKFFFNFFFKNPEFWSQKCAKIPVKKNYTLECKKKN